MNARIARAKYSRVLFGSSSPTRYAKTSEASGHWITLKPHGNDRVGVHVLISESGLILRGPGELSGKHITQLSAEHRRAETLRPAAHSYLVEQHTAHEAAKQNARRITGLHAGHLARIENKYRDHSSVPGFDTSSRTAAREIPDLGLDPDAHDTPARLWELIREGKRERPTLNSDETTALATEWAKSHRQHKTAEPVYEHDGDWNF